MKSNKLLKFIGIFALLLSGATSAQQLHYGAGDAISDAVFVTDADNSSISLAELLKLGEMTVLFIFGGGDMGSGQPGYLWCQDSFEDSHIFRTLYANYASRDVNFVAVASAPVYHTAFLGHPEGVFLNAEAASDAFETAKNSFINSTMQAFEAGILPVEPFFDLRLRLMLNPDGPAPGAGYGTKESWMGAFRQPDEQQFYGVPSVWLLSPQGKVLHAPFRGNIYHPHGVAVNINYTYSDVASIIDSLL